MRVTFVAIPGPGFHVRRVAATVDKKAGHYRSLLSYVCGLCSCVSWLFFVRPSRASCFRGQGSEGVCTGPSYKEKGRQPFDGRPVLLTSYFVLTGELYSPRSPVRGPSASSGSTKYSMSRSSSSSSSLGCGSAGGGGGSSAGIRTCR